MGGCVVILHFLRNGGSETSVGPARRSSLFSSRDFLLLSATNTRGTLQLQLLLVVVVEGENLSTDPPASAMNRAGGQKDCEPGAAWDILLQHCVSASQTSEDAAGPRGECRNLRGRFSFSWGLGVPLNLTPAVLAVMETPHGIALNAGFPAENFSDSGFILEHYCCQKNFVFFCLTVWLFPTSAPLRISERSCVIVFVSFK